MARPLAALIARLEESDVHELARHMAGWAAQLDSAIDRRSLLLKLSFALTLAAAAPEGSTTTDSEIRLSSGSPEIDLSGVWRSEYTYYSRGRATEFTGVHYVVVRQTDRGLSVGSLPHTTGSELEMSLALDGMTATGSWAGHTSPTGYYKGAVYRGALQMLIDPSGGRMTGRLARLRQAVPDQQRRLGADPRIPVPVAANAQELRAQGVGGPVTTATIDEPGANRPTSTKENTPYTILAT